jgi:hypothetical protein
MVVQRYEMTGMGARTARRNIREEKRRFSLLGLQCQDDRNPAHDGDEANLDSNLSYLITMSSSWPLSGILQDPSSKGTILTDASRYAKVLLDFSFSGVRLPRFSPHYGGVHQM